MSKYITHGVTDGRSCTKEEGDALIGLDLKPVRIGNRVAILRITRSAGVMAPDDEGQTIQTMVHLELYQNETRVSEATPAENAIVERLFPEQVSPSIRNH